MCKLLKTLFAVWLTVILFCSDFGYSQSISASPTRPSASDNAFITANGYSELELGFASQKNYWSTPALLKITVFNKLEMGFMMNGLVSSFTSGNVTETKSGDPGLQLKYQFINNETFAFSAVARSEFIKSNTKLTFYIVPSFLTNFGQIDVTTAFSEFNTNSTLFYALAYSPKVDLPFGFYLELFGEKGNNLSSISFDAGISYPLSSTFILDAAFAKGLNSDAAGYQFQIGITKTLFKVFH